MTCDHPYMTLEGAVNLRWTVLYAMLFPKLDPSLVLASAASTMHRIGHTITYTLDAGHASNQP